MNYLHTAESPCHWDALGWADTMSSALATDDFLALIPAESRARLLTRAQTVMTVLTGYGVTGPAQIAVLGPQSKDLKIAIANAAENSGDVTAASLTPADRFATHRNAFVTVLGLAAIQHGHSLGWLWDNAPQVKNRSGIKGRPLMSDEITVMRVAAWPRLLASTYKGRQPAAYYLLSEIGARPGETTQITDKAFDRLDHPTVMTAPGLKVGCEPRDLPLDAFQSRAATVLIEATLRHRPSGSRLAYGGELTTNKELCAAASGPIKDFLTAVGLVDKSLTASSACKYSAATAAGLGDLALATKLMGASSADRAKDRLGYEWDNSQDIDTAQDDDISWDDEAA